MISKNKDDLVWHIILDFVEIYKNKAKAIENLFIEQISEIKKYYRFICVKCLQIQFIRNINKKFLIISSNLYDYTNKMRTEKNNLTWKE